MKKLLLSLMLLVSVNLFSQLYSDSLTTKTYIDIPTVEYWMIRYINIERMNCGLDTLIYNKSVDYVSNRHTKWMCETGRYEHSGLNITENIMNSSCRAGRTHQQIAKGAVDAWMSSTPHRKHILDPKFKYIGTGFAYKITHKELGFGETYYTVNFEYDSDPKYFVYY